MDLKAQTAELASDPRVAGAEHASQSRSPSRLSAPANLDTLRGIACLMVVIVHVVGPTSASGLRIPDSSLWHGILEPVRFFLMPLFTAMAGYLYALRPRLPVNFAGFVQRKAEALIVPALFVGTLFWTMRTIAYGPHIALPEALLTGYIHLWYLYAIMVIFIVVGLIDAFARPGTVQWLVIALAALLLYRVVPHMQLFGLSAALSLIPYFILGILLSRNQHWIRNNIVQAAAGATLAAYYAGRFVFELPGLDRYASPTVTAVASLAAILCLLRFMPKIDALAWIAPLSFTIYLWHPLGNAAVRGVLRHEGISNLPLLFVAGTLAGVFIPVAIHKAAQRVPPFISVLGTGTRSRRKARA
jgi:surface polysaccharide O-acyltransferase-like enzyme